MTSSPGGPPPIDSVLLIGFGGPDRPEEVVAFLQRVTAGRGVPQSRLDEVAQHYELVGGRSPYNEQTEALAGAVRVSLSALGHALPVHIGMRNWHPLLADTLGGMAAAGLRHAAGVILAAHRSEASWERYMRDVDAALATAAPSMRMISVTYLAPWFDAAEFLEAAALRIEAATGYRRGCWPAGVPLVFTAHSIPESMARSSPYVADLTSSCKAVAALLGVRTWRLAYQSRSGNPRDPWLEPDILDVLRECGRQGCAEVAVQAIGFLSDHVEVLFDLDVEARQVADSLGIKMTRAACVGSHPLFAAMIARRVLALADSV